MVEIKEQETETHAAPINMVDAANAAAERLEKANAELKTLVEREEALKAHSIISGKANAGKEPIPTPEESPEEYAKKVMANGL